MTNNKTMKRSEIELGLWKDCPSCEDGIRLYPCYSDCLCGEDHAEECQTCDGAGGWFDNEGVPDEE